MSRKVTMPRFRPARVLVLGLPLALDWAAVGQVPYGFHPLMIGLAFLLPLDVLYTAPPLCPPTESKRLGSLRLRSPGTLWVRAINHSSPARALGCLRHCKHPIP